MKKNIIKSLAYLMFLSIGVLCSCTDTWDEHYGGNSENSQAFDGTIMDFLKQNSNLSDFVEIVEATGYDLELNSSQSFTIWAPVNGSFDKNEWLELAKTNKQDVITRFIKNHMTRYNVSLDNQKHRISLLNNKTVSMSDESEHTFGSAEILSYNTVCDNGVINVISEAQPYLDNIYEQIERQYAQWKAEAAAKGEVIIDDSVLSMYSFLKKYNSDSLDQSRSVSIGVDENGEYIWIDSVMMRNNTILKSIGALVYHEDSLYSMILPSVDAYIARVNEAKTCLRFNPVENVADQVDQAVSTTDSLQYYYANLFAMSDLFYNDNNNRNLHSNDSVVSTQWTGGKEWEFHRYYRPFEPGGIFNQGQKILCSNGYVYQYNDYPISVYDQFLRKVETSCDNMNIDKTKDSAGKDLYTKLCDGAFPWLSATNAETGKLFSFVDIKPTTSASPTVTFQVKNILKTTYDIYLVYSPLWVKKYPSYAAAYEAAMADSLAQADNKNATWKVDAGLAPYYFQVNVFEREGTSKNLGKYPSKGRSMKNPETDKTYYTGKVENAIDTMYIGQFSPEYSYYHTDKEGILIQFDVKITSSQAKNTYSREMYFSKILFVPHKD